LTGLAFLSIGESITSQQLLGVISISLGIATLAFLDGADGQVSFMLLLPGRVLRATACSAGWVFDLAAIFWVSAASKYAVLAQIARSDGKIYLPPALRYVGNRTSGAETQKIAARSNTHPAEQAVARNTRPGKSSINET